MTPGVPALRTTVERSASRVVVCAHGELDLATAAAMRRAVVAAGGSGPTEVVVDLSGVTFVDATGLSALLQAADVLRGAGGGLHLASPSRMVRRMLRLLDLEQRLPVA